MIKRFFDIFVSGSALMLLSPVFLIIAAQVRLKLGSPVLFWQQRAGFEGKPFIMVKFRTMRDVFDSSGCLLPDKNRMTSFGVFLRSYSLDELPELLNVLKGDMSLVGPRPLLLEYMALYTPEQQRRCNVKPGVTGWAQINGRNQLSWEKKFQLDVWYVDNRTFWLDIYIMLVTVKKIFTRDGVSGNGEVTMSKFVGTKNKDA